MVETCFFRYFYTQNKKKETWLIMAPMQRGYLQHVGFIKQSLAEHKNDDPLAYCVAWKFPFESTYF